MRSAIATAARKAVTGGAEGWLDELLLALALVLVTSGLWSVLGSAALTVPGGVLLWIVMPSRAAFIARPPESAQRSRDGGK